MRRTALGIAAVFAMGRAARAGARLGLDAEATGRDWTYQSDWDLERERALEEQLHATLDGYLYQRALVNYRLGLSFAHLTSLGSFARSDAFAWGYDGLLSVWQGGPLPVTVWGSRGVRDMSSGAVPTSRTISRIEGASAGLAPRGAPRVDFSGYRWSVLDEADGELTLREGEDVAGSFTQVSDGLLTTAAIDRRLSRGPSRDQSRDATTGDVYVDYRAGSDLDVILRGWDRDASAQYGDEPVRTRDQASQGLAQYRWSDATTGLSSVDFFRAIYDGDSTSGASADSTIRHTLDRDTWLSGTLGASYDEAITEEDVDRFAGESVSAEVGRGFHSSGGSLLEVQTGAGTAQFTELGDGTGFQTATSGSLRGLQPVGNRLRLTAEGNAGRQWDTSPVDLDATRWGAGAGTDVQIGWGTSASAWGERAVLRQLSQEEGDFDRTSLYSVVRSSPAPRLRVTGSAAWERAQLDEESTETQGASGEVDVSVAPHLDAVVLVWTSRWQSDDLEPWGWTRAEGQLRFLEGRLAASLRAGRIWTGGSAAPATTTYVWLEVTRSFGWDL